MLFMLKNEVACDPTELENNLYFSKECTVSSRDYLQKSDLFIVHKKKSKWQEINQV
jgi:hypothetical protein